MNLNAASTAELVANYIGALGTLSAVLVALFLQVFLVSRQRPELRVTLSDEIDDEDVHLLEGDNSFEYYLRVKVWAQPKRRAANRVQGFLLRVTRPEEAGDTSTRRVPDGTLRWAGATLTEQVDIAPGTWRRLDILRYRCVRDSGKSILTPAMNRPATRTQWPPSMRYQLTDTGTYTLDFVVSCDEAIPTFWRLTFHLGAGDAKSPADLASAVKNPRIERIHGLHLS